MSEQVPATGAPQGVNMPKKRDPRLRGVQQPRPQQFFDSADYEVRKQQQQQANAHRTGAQGANPIARGPQPASSAGVSGHAAPSRSSPEQTAVAPQRRQVPPPPPPPPAMD